MQKRSIPMSIFLSIITAGIYGIFWFFKVTEEVIEELNYAAIDSPSMNVLYVIITFGVYYFWWNYKMSTYLSTLERKNDIEPDFWGPIFSLYFGIILHQTRLNRIILAKKNG